MKYAILLEAEEEGGFSVTVPDLPGCISQGETEEDCRANITEAIEGWIETARANEIAMSENSLPAALFMLISPPSFAL